jgi:hypothetical protein
MDVDYNIPTYATEDETDHPPQNEGDELSTETALHITKPVSQASTDASNIAPPPPTFNDGAPSFAQLDCTHKWKYRSIYNLPYLVRNSLLL